MTPALAWEVESLLLKIFEYGDYSFRSALSGAYSETLVCTFFLARQEKAIVGVAACLYARKSASIAIIGPVGVAAEYRGNGIGTKLVRCVVDFLQKQCIQAVYLGVSKDGDVTGFYKKLGFSQYSGIVMRRVLGSEEKFEERYVGGHNFLRIQPVVWGDMPEICRLMAYPCSICTFDFRRNIFSSKYVEPGRFLSVFPEMMKWFSSHGGFANVLVSGTLQNIAGIAHVSRLAGQARRHIAVLDFYVYDNYIEHTDLLVCTTVTQAACLGVKKLYCYCLGCDTIKQDVIKTLDGRQIALLPGDARINDRFEDILIYQMPQLT